MGDRKTLRDLRNQVRPPQVTQTLLQKERDVIGFEADFDEDGDVDGMDLTRWRSGFATGATHMQGNADGDGDVDGADFLIWQRQFGGGAATAAAMAVPEPATAGLVSVGIALGCWRRRRKYASTD